MWKIVFSLMIYLPLVGLEQVNKARISIIPEPVNIIQKSGEFILPDSIFISASIHSDLIVSVDFLTEKIRNSTGKQVNLSSARDATIILSLNKGEETSFGKAGYKLSVSSSRIKITADQPKGIFYGVMSLLQLFPTEIESDTIVHGLTWAVPNVEIIDYPRFEWRGVMLDVSRHFFSKDEVKQFISQMVRFKFNLLHLHLTDDHGWRIEIKSLPKLTEIGAWNVKRTGYLGTFSPPSKDEPRDYGGFYTHEDIEELVNYAKKHFVDILPEIDVPGHSLAAIASYPDLSFTPGSENYQVNSGETIWDHTQTPKRLMVDNNLNPANEEVYNFLDKVFTEVAQLFPFKYIHVGGDEVSYDFWRNDLHIKTLMKREKLKDMSEVQGYFIKRMEDIVSAKSKTMIGWDEILDDSLPNKKVVAMSWRGQNGGIEAQKRGHQVVMCPNNFTYLDYMQGDAAIEPPMYSTLLLSKAYQFNPAPEGTDSRFVLGGQANIWTEQIYNMRHLEYMLWPRALAISESLWTPLEKKDWNHFYRRVENQFSRFDRLQIKYSPAIYDPKLKFTTAENGELKIEMVNEIKTLDIHYSFDNSYPDQFYPIYTGPLSVPKDASMLRVVTYRKNKKIGRMISISIKEMKRRAKLK